ncbi:MAG: hypothetical protein A3J29_14215 [Acidobacteria bacterium RIFCSPLOWO2_12_FULL_67_14b]|nr:MAG: hypothetical protein A3J29_14215 [Acidobacteria bacterium RIFCSPLOWO2_12_FULL_67_14b]
MIDSWATLLIANTVTIIRMIAPTRSDQGARLKKTHHNAIANAPATPPSMPTGICALGATTGTPNMTSS